MKEYLYILEQTYQKPEKEEYRVKMLYWLQYEGKIIKENRNRLSLGRLDKALNIITYYALSKTPARMVIKAVIKKLNKDNLYKFLNQDIKRISNLLESLNRRTIKDDPGIQKELEELVK